MGIGFSLLGYLFLFLGLCVLVFLGLAFTNIINKSYNPKKAIIIVVFLLCLFFINALMIYLSFTRTVGIFNNSTNQNNSNIQSNF